ncbi:inositol monophosphatase family protein [Nitrospina watsonii]|uniref:Histidinol-phosphatase (Alternative form) n=1 Tax=Nitrospina watsonii TaxID=1323948 RepID=A0ABM9HD80_9BACT|nr:inositol monophosphatase family protein [Nitrospina watsonii]CAI2718131.1 Histidinol-phosphatase (alternative form) [Nitrospina watsonii]
MKELLAVKDSALSWLKPVNREIMKWFRNDVTVDLKPDQSPVTIADRKAEEMLRRRIRKEYPDHGIIGEEFGNIDPDREWVWTVDPIDGTRSFVRGLPLFAVLLSLLHRGEPVLGVIGLPALGETAWAVQGQGAWCGERRLQVSRETRLEQATVGAADTYCFRETKRLKLLQSLQQRAQLVRTYPDAFGHLMAIRGALDVMVDPLAYVWDYAPIKILAREAGGAFENFSGKKACIEEGTALVGNPELVRQIRKLAAPARSKK